MIRFLMIALLFVNCGNKIIDNQALRNNESKCLSHSISKAELNIPKGLKLDYVGRFEMFAYKNYPIRYEVKTPLGWEMYWSCKFENNQKKIYKSKLNNYSLSILNDDGFYFNLIDLKVKRIKPVKNLHASYILTSSNCIYLWVKDIVEDPYLIDLITKSSKINEKLFLIDGRNIIF